MPLTLVTELTGASQLVALLFAPIFGYLSDRYRRFNVSLLVSSFIGVIGYIGFALLKSPEISNKNGRGGSPVILVLVVLLGISQIGAIVCSLGILGRGVLGDQGGYIVSTQLDAPSSADDTEPFRIPTPPVGRYDATDTQPPANGTISNLPPSLPSSSPHQQPATSSTPLLPRKSSAPSPSHSHLKGSIAGVYSLAGGAGILLLTKLGGYLFDNLATGAPFYMLAGFNGGLLVVGILGGVGREVFRWGRD
jgi:hypothetical protein